MLFLPSGLKRLIIVPRLLIKLKKSKFYIKEVNFLDYIIKLREIQISTGEYNSRFIFIFFY